MVSVARNVLNHWRDTTCTHPLPTRRSVTPDFFVFLSLNKKSHSHTICACDSAPLSRPLLSPPLPPLLFPLPHTLHHPLPSLSPPPSLPTLPSHHHTTPPPEERVTNGVKGVCGSASGRLSSAFGVRQTSCAAGNQLAVLGCVTGG